MQIQLEIDESFFPHFKAMLESLERDKKLSIVAMDEEYDYTKNVPEPLIVSSVEEVRRRVAEAEKRIEAGEYLSEEEYEKEMDRFFQEELGLQR